MQCTKILMLYVKRQLLLLFIDDNIRCNVITITAVDYDC